MAQTSNGMIWSNLISHGAEIIDAAGRNTASNSREFGNSIVSYIQAAKGEYPTIEYESDSDKWIAIAVIAVCATVALIFVYKF